MLENVETIIVGTGHAGLSVSCHLTNARRGHLVLERGQIGEISLSQRWDSFTVNSPNSPNQLPGDQSPLSTPTAFSIGTNHSKIASLMPVPRSCRYALKKK